MPSRPLTATQLRFTQLTALVFAAAAAFVLVPALRTEAGGSALVILFCLLATLSGAVPLRALPALLVIAAPLVLLRFGAAYAPWNVLAGSVHPVLITFTCGLAFAVIAKEHGLDLRFMNFALARSRGRFYRLAALVIATTVWLSAWISNVAAAGLVFATIAPALDDMQFTKRQRELVLLLIAISANLAGMMTPVGTGANAVAIAETLPQVHIGFAKWIVFAAPLAILLITAACIAASAWLRPGRTILASREQIPTAPLTAAVPAIFIATVTMWLLEPLHGIEAHWVSAVSLALMLMTRALKLRDLQHLDWSVLLLIMGGIGFGHLVEVSGLATALIDPGLLQQQGETAMLFAFCAAAAVLSALMSNTGTAAALIPVATTIMPSPSTAILIALATGLGFPFAISTPANALAVRHGARSSHLLVIGSAITILGAVLLATTGRMVLTRMGIP
jgi:sodium-dependent dicarboxylate transporter 2/3/5